MVWLLESVPIRRPLKERMAGLFPPEEPLSRAARGETLLKVAGILFLRGCGCFRIIPPGFSHLLPHAFFVAVFGFFAKPWIPGTFLLLLLVSLDLAPCYWHHLLPGIITALQTLLTCLPHSPETQSSACKVLLSRAACGQQRIQWLFGREMFLSLLRLGHALGSWWQGFRLGDNMTWSQTADNMTWSSFAWKQIVMVTPAFSKEGTTQS